MNALVRKEARVIAPAWGVALLAMAAGPAASDAFSIETWAFCLIAFWLAMTLLGLSPFGREFSFTSFSVLLAQPIARKRLWQVKSGWVGVAAISLFGLSLFVWANLSDTRHTDADWGAFLAGNAVGLALLTGGLWSTLLFRQITAALWITLLIPGALALGVAQSTEWLCARLEPTMQNATPNPQSIIPLAVTVILVLYSLAGYWWARRLFLRAQDVGWAAAEKPMLGISCWFKARPRPVGEQNRGPVRALVVKECQLHSLSLFFAAGVLVLHLAAIGVRKFGSESSAWYGPATIAFLFWFVLPLIAGAEAVASERQLGTMEGQLCLPARRRTQFVLKLCFVLATGVILGGVMPWLLEHAARALGIASELETNREALCWFSGFGILLALISFYASSLTRSTLQALGGAVVGAIAVWMLVLLGRPTTVIVAQRPLGGLYHLIGGPTLAVTLIGLCYWNFKRLHQARQLLRRNLAVLIAWLVFTVVATPLVYQRVWELVISPEPRHGPVRIVGSNNAKLCVSGERFFVLLPDGRIWAATNQDHANYPRTGTFLTGSNWVDLAGGTFAVAAIRADGSLWSLYQERRTVYEARDTERDEAAPVASLEAIPGPTPGQTVSAKSPPNKVDAQFGTKPLPPAATATNLSMLEPSQQNSGEWSLAFRRKLLSQIEVQRATSSLERIGTDSDWKSLAAGRGHFLALKRDGTIWGWGENTSGQLGEGPEWFVNGPARLGQDSDWTTVFAEGNTSVGVKRDGSVWKWGFLYRMADNLMMKPIKRAEPVRWNLPGTNLLFFDSHPYYDLGLYDDGSVQAVGYVRPTVLLDQHTSNFSDDMKKWINGLAVMPIRINPGQSWRGFMMGETLLALHADGSLWKHEKPWMPGGTAALAKLSVHSDWLTATSPAGDTALALARDGTMSCWTSSQPHRPDALLAPSRGPLWSLNIFDATK